MSKRVWSSRRRIEAAVGHARGIENGLLCPLGEALSRNVCHGLLRDEIAATRITPLAARCSRDADCRRIGRRGGGEDVEDGRLRAVALIAGKELYVEARGV